MIAARSACSCVAVTFACFCFLPGIIGPLEPVVVRNTSHSAGARNTFEHVYAGAMAGETRFFPHPRKGIVEILAGPLISFWPLARRSRGQPASDLRSGSMGTGKSR